MKTLPPAALENFVTIRVPANGYTGLPCYAVVPFVPLVAEIRPKPKKLTSWKEILACSVAHGGPTSSSYLRKLCKERNAPVYVWAGIAALADEDRFIWWLESLRVPIGLSRPGAFGGSPARRPPDGGRRKAKEKGTAKGK